MRAGSPLAYDLDAVNVGQRVRIFGSLAGTAMAASGPADVIRLQPTFVFGYATGAPVAGLLTLDVARIGLLDESAFTWSGSGSNPPDPAAFTVDAAGLVGGLAINTAHELGHKNSRIEKLLAKLVLAVPAYGHFTIDHNLGHHRNVSTPGDPASARMGESIYKFAAREIPGALKEAWTIERDRLQRRERAVWHPSNQILQSYYLTALLNIALIAWLGWVIVPFLLLHHASAYWQLTSANYVEHYGLLREQDENGNYERCQPRHSWNSNHVFSNLVLFHLERHSDHHANPLRRYQALRHFDDAPQLPNGYFGVYLLAYVPALWFRVMDKRLLALGHVKGDLDKVNICPDARAAIFLKYGKDKMIEPTLS